MSLNTIFVVPESLPTVNVVPPSAPTQAPATSSKAQIYAQENRDIVNTAVGITFGVIGFFVLLCAASCLMRKKRKPRDIERAGGRLQPRRFSSGIQAGRRQPGGCHGGGRSGGYHSPTPTRPPSFDGSSDSGQSFHSASDVVVRVVSPRGNRPGLQDPPPYDSTLAQGPSCGPQGGCSGNFDQGNTNNSDNINNGHINSININNAAIARLHERIIIRQIDGSSSSLSVCSGSGSCGCGYRRGPDGGPLPQFLPPCVLPAPGSCVEFSCPGLCPGPCIPPCPGVYLVGPDVSVCPPVSIKGSAIDLKTQRTLKRHEQDLSILLGEVGDHNQAVDFHERVLGDHERLVRDHERIIEDHERVVEDHAEELENHERELRELNQRMASVENDTEDIRKLVGEHRNIDRRIDRRRRDKSDGSSTSSGNIPPKRGVHWTDSVRGGLSQSDSMRGPSYHSSAYSSFSDGGLGRPPIRRSYSTDRHDFDRGVSSSLPRSRPQSAGSAFRCGGSPDNFNDGSRSDIPTRPRSRSRHVPLGPHLSPAVGNINLGSSGSKIYAHFDPRFREPMGMNESLRGRETSRFSRSDQEDSELQHRSRSRSPDSPHFRSSNSRRINTPGRNNELSPPPPPLPRHRRPPPHIHRHHSPIFRTDDPDQRQYGSYPLRSGAAMRRDPPANNHMPQNSHNGIQRPPLSRGGPIPVPRSDRRNSMRAGYRLNNIKGADGRSISP